MKHKSLFLFIALMGILLPGVAQQSKQDVIYLKNGSIIRGQLQASSTTEKVAIQTADKSVWVFAASEVEKVTQEMPPKKELQIPTKGMYGTLAYINWAGRNDYGLTLNGGVRGTLGYQFDAHNAVAVAGGLQSFEEGLLHTSLEYRRYLKTTSSSPYIAGFGGYSFPMVQGNDWRTYFGGINTGIKVGLRHHVSDHFAVDLGLGFAYQRTRVKYVNDWWGFPRSESEYITQYKRISFDIGFLLH